MTLNPKIRKRLLVAGVFFVVFISFLFLYFLRV